MRDSVMEDELLKYLNNENAISEGESVWSKARRLIFGGRQLDDQATLADYGIADKSMLHENARLRGGGIQFYKPIYTQMYGDDGIEEGQGLGTYRCRYCNKTNQLTVDPWKAIKDHIATAKHQRCKPGGQVQETDWRDKYQDQVHIIRSVISYTSHSIRALGDTPVRYTRRLRL